MSPQTKPTCQVLQPGATYTGKQAFTYFAGISAESVGAQGLCLHLLTIPPGGRAKAHMHEQHETAIYVVSGTAAMWYGAALEHHAETPAGSFVYIPAGMPHLPYNPSTTEPCTAVIARTDPNERESVVLRPDLEPLAVVAA